MPDDFPDDFSAGSRGVSVTSRPDWRKTAVYIPRISDPEGEPSLHRGADYRGQISRVGGGLAVGSESLSVSLYSAPRAEERHAAWRDVMDDRFTDGLSHDKQSIPTSCR